MLLLFFREVNLVEKLFHIVLCRMVNYWCRILKSSHDRAIYNCYQYQLHLSDTNRPCWATDLKQALFTFGFGDVWMAQGAGNWDGFKHDFKWRSEAIEYQNWYGCVQNFGNLRTYKLCKFEQTVEWYLTLDLPRKIVNSIVRFRGGLLRIGINEGRYENIPYLERICKLCNSNEIDDESHFLFRCTTLSTFRLPLLNFHIFRSGSFKSVFEAKNRLLILDPGH